MYEGTPDHPGQGPVVVDHRAVRGDHPLLRPDRHPHLHEVGRPVAGGHDLSSLRLLGSVGEPINPEAWMWYATHIGGGRCPVVDTWWQTETGAIMIAPLPGITTTKPGSATFPLPGIGAEVVDEEGKPVDQGGGYLTLTRPVALDAAGHLRRPRALPGHLLEPVRRAGTSRATAPSSTTTAICGCSAGSTTS